MATRSASTEAAEAVAAEVNAEQRVHDLEQRFVELRQQLAGVTAERDKLRRDVKQFEAEVQQANARAADAEDSNESAKRAKQQCEAHIEKLEDSKKISHDQLDRKLVELDHMREDLKTLSQQLSASQAKEADGQKELSELRASQVPLQCSLDRMRQEKAVLEKHKEWLDSELAAKTKAMLDMRKEHTTALLELQSNLDAKVEELRHVRTQASQARSEADKLEEKLRESQTQLKEAGVARVTTESDTAKALATQQRLAELYQQGKRQAETKVGVLEARLKSLQAESHAAHEAAKAQNDRNMKEAETRLQKQYDASQSRIKELEARVSQDTDHNAVSKEGGGSPALGTDAGVSSSNEATLSLAKRLVDEGVGLTDVYSRVVQAEEALRLERVEKKKLELYLQQILHEVESKAPVIAGQRLDYERALASHDELSKRLDESNRKRVASEQQTEAARRELSDAIVERRALEQQTADLARQLQALLREQLAQRERGTGSVQSAVSTAVTSPFAKASMASPAMPGTPKTLTPGATAHEVISENLVEYRNVEELQRKNQQLVLVVRKLSAKKEQQEHEEEGLSGVQLKRALRDTMQQLEDVRAARKRQEEMVVAIVRQRDMYRELLAQANEGFSKPGEGGRPNPIPQDQSDTPDGSATSGSSPATATPSAASQALAGTSEEVVAAQRAAAENAQRLKDTRNELNIVKEERGRLGRQLETARSELYATKSDALRSEADAKHHQERYERLESTLETANAEVNRLRQQGVDYQGKIVEHQKQLAVVNAQLAERVAECSRLVHEVENARAELKIANEAENSARDDAKALRVEVERQANLVETLQRIEAAMDSKAAVEIQALKDERDTLRKEVQVKTKRLDEGQQQMTQQQRTSAMDLKAANAKAENARNDAAAAHKQAANAALRVKDATAQVARLEKELAARQAQIREMRQRLNAQDRATQPSNTTADTGDDDAAATHVELQSELEAARAAHKEAAEHIKQYSAIAAANEKALAELQASTEAMKKQKQAELDAKLEELAAVRMQEKRASELSAAAGEEVARLREALRLERDKNVSSAKRTREAGEDHKAELAAAHVRIEALKKDLDVHRAAKEDAQANYARELQLHATDVKALADLKASTEALSSSLEEAEVNLASATATLADKEASWLEQRQKLEGVCAAAKEASAALQHQNGLLHSQLELLGQQVKALQSDRESTALEGNSEVDGSSTSTKDKMLAELRELLRYEKREKEMADCKTEVAEQEQIRLSQQLEQTREQLNATRSDLQALTERKGKDNDQEYQNLLVQVQQVNLVRESNAALRHDNEEQKTLIERLEGEVSELRASLEPHIARERKIVSEKQAAEEEVAMLKKENAEWSKRMDGLFKKHPTVDPAEHKALQDKLKVAQSKIEADASNYEKTRSSLAEQQQLVQKHSTRLNELETMATSKDAQIERLRTLLRKQGPMLQQLKSEKKVLEEKEKVHEVEKKALMTQIDSAKAAAQQAMAKGKAGAAAQSKGDVQLREQLKSASAGKAAAEAAKSVAEKKSAALDKKSKQVLALSKQLQEKLKATQNRVKQLAEVLEENKIDLPPRPAPTQAAQVALATEATPVASPATKAKGKAPIQIQGTPGAPKGKAKVQPKSKSEQLEEKAKARAKATAEAKAKAKAEAQAKAKAKAVADAKAKATADAKARAAADAKAAAEADAKAAVEAEAKAECEAKAKAESEAKAKAEAEAKAKAEAAKTKALAAAKAKALAAAKAKAAAAAKAKAAAAAKVKAEAEARAKADAEAKAKAEIEAKAKAEAETKAKMEAEANLVAVAQTEVETAAEDDTTASVEMQAKVNTAASAPSQKRKRSLDADAPEFQPQSSAVGGDAKKAKPASTGTAPFLNLKPPNADAALPTFGSTTSWSFGSSTTAPALDFISAAKAAGGGFGALAAPTGSFGTGSATATAAFGVSQEESAGASPQQQAEPQDEDAGDALDADDDIGVPASDNEEAEDVQTEEYGDDMDEAAPADGAGEEDAENVDDEGNLSINDDGDNEQ